MVLPLQIIRRPGLWPQSPTAPTGSSTACWNCSVRSQGFRPNGPIRWIWNDWSRSTNV